MAGAERTRVEGFGHLENGLRDAGDWYLWGPYLSERQWGTVREDYSADGDAWSYFPHDHARSRAYRWGEDGMAGFSDIEQRLCLVAWRCGTASDPILKERMFGLTGAQANHGEDVKEYWWYLDAVPSHAWNRWRYHYPQAAFPYADLIAENGRRGKFDPEYELLDTGVFDDDRYWIVEVDYVKADADDLIMVVRVTNAGPDADDAARAADGLVPQHVELGPRRAQARACARGPTAPSRSTTRSCGELELLAGAGAGRHGADGAVLRERDQRRAACTAPTRPRRIPKDGINDHVVDGATPPSTPTRCGTKASLWYQVEVAAGATAELRLRLRPAGSKPPEAVVGARQGRRRASSPSAARRPTSSTPS